LSPVLTTGSFVVSLSGNPLSIEGLSLSALSEGSSLSASSFFFPPLWPHFFRFLAVDFGASFFAVDLAVAFGAGFFALDFGARCFGGDRSFGGDLGVAARRVGDAFGVTVSEFPAPPNLVGIGNMVPVDFGARCFGGDRCFHGNLGVAARRVGDDFGVVVGEFPAPPDLVVIGDMVS
jgi:hypothetical protein